jgi:hypothetical protein
MEGRLDVSVGGVGLVDPFVAGTIEARAAIENMFGFAFDKFLKYSAELNPPAVASLSPKLPGGGAVFVALLGPLAVNIALNLASLTVLTD